MKIAVVQSGTVHNDGRVDYSITTRRQIDSLNLFDDVTVRVFLVTHRTNIFGFIKNFQCLQKEIHLFKPDIVHSHYGSIVGFMALIIALKSRTKLIISFCGDDILGSSNSGLTWMFRNKLMIFVSSVVSLRADYIIVKSSNLHKALKKYARKKATVIPNGVNSTFFKPNAVNSFESEFRKNVRHSGTVVKIFFNASEGSNQAVKNLALAKSTIVELNKAGVTSKLITVNNVKPKEFKDKLLSSDCLLLTSFHEGSPNVVKEALACNIPVVSVDCGDVKELLVEVNKGGVVAKYDERLLALKIMEVLESNEYFNGRAQFMKMGLDESVIAQKIIDLYRIVQS